MRLRRMNTARADRLVRVFGDCECGHSVVYHLPIVGCTKCGCDEFH